MNNKTIRFSNLFYFLAFLTASFDIFLVMHIQGFTLRIVYLFIAIVFVLFIIRLIFKHKFKIPYGFALLAIWALFIIAFIPNTPLLTRNIGYAIWLLINISFVFVIANADTDSYKLILRLYLISFFVMAIIGLIQFALPILGLPSFYTMQWWVPNKLPRINGFNYEPSYYATYMMIGFATTFWLFIKGNTIGFSKKFFFVMVGTELVALILCSSRMGYLAISILVMFTIFVFIINLLAKLKIKKKIILIILLGVIFGTVGFGAMLKMSGGIERLLSGVGLKGASSHSVDARIKGMEDTFEIFKQSPIIGVSLGGVAPARAKILDLDINSNIDAKKTEGLNIFLEILAASGIFGFIFFIGYLVYLFVFPFRTKINNKQDKVVVNALLIALFLELFLLTQNQNILRPYFWIHLGVISLVYRVIKDKNRAEINNEDNA